MESSESEGALKNFNFKLIIFIFYRMVNAQGYTRLPNVPIIITGNKNLATNQGTGQSIVLQANPNSTGAFILNPQNQLKVQGNILTHVRKFV